MKQTPERRAEKAPVLPSKPKCKLIGGDGNVFAIIGTVRNTLRRAGMPERAEEFQNKAMSSESYDKVLQLCMEYVEVC